MNTGIPKYRDDSIHQISRLDEYMNMYIASLFCEHPVIKNDVYVYVHVRRST